LQGFLCILAFREYTQADTKKFRRGAPINFFKCIFIALSRFFERNNEGCPVIISTTTGKFITGIGGFSVDS
jgi:hypothetical protein